MDPDLVPKMKPLPDELQFGREMVLSVALEMEEKRRQMPKQTPEEMEEDGEDREEGEDQVDFISHAPVLGAHILLLLLTKFENVNPWQIDRKF